MQLISNDDGTWEMLEVRELELLMLSKIAESADPGDSQAAFERLYPSPLGRPSIDESEDEIMDDWESLIHPDLKEQFNSAIGVVQADLAEMKSKKRGGEMEYSLKVPKKHADDWCSALNQARLVLHEKYKLPDEDEELEDENGHGQWMALVQSEIYGGVIEFLVQEILWLK